MSLNTWEQQVLASITDRLTRSDPELASLLGAFSRHASGEEMSASERIRPDSRQAIWRSRCQRRHLRRGRVRRPASRVGAYRRPGFALAAMLLWFLTTVTLIAVALTLDHGSSQRACTMWVAGCAGSAPAHNSRPASDGTATSQAPQQGSGQHPASRSTVAG
jgi:hypothetical protein